MTKDFEIGVGKRNCKTRCMIHGRDMALQGIDV